MAWQVCISPPDVEEALSYFRHGTGVEIISNSSGSHHELRKLDTRLNLITQATKLVITPTLSVSSTSADSVRAVVSTSTPISKAVMEIDSTMTAVL